MEKESLEMLKDICVPKSVCVPMFSQVPLSVKVEIINNDIVHKENRKVMRTQQKGVKITVKKLLK